MPIGVYERKPRGPYKPLADKFWKNVDKSGECWEWTASKLKAGYGRVWTEGSTKMAHRVSYELENGPIPNDKFICHTCDNPGCVRPSHLFVGNALTNMQDKVNKGRHVPSVGELNGSAKITEDIVILIRAKGDRMSQQSLADMYNISQAQVGNIIRRKSWAHI